MKKEKYVILNTDETNDNSSKLKRQNSLSKSASLPYITISPEKSIETSLNISVLVNKTKTFLENIDSSKLKKNKPEQSNADFFNDCILNQLKSLEKILKKESKLNNNIFNEDNISVEIKNQYIFECFLILKFIKEAINYQHIEKFTLTKHLDKLIKLKNSFSLQDKHLEMTINILNEYILKNNDRILLKIGSHENLEKEKFNLNSNFSKKRRKSSNEIEKLTKNMSLLERRASVFKQKLNTNLKVQTNDLNEFTQKKKKSENYTDYEADCYLFLKKYIDILLFVFLLFLSIILIIFVF